MIIYYKCFRNYNILDTDVELVCVAARIKVQVAGDCSIQSVSCLFIMIIQVEYFYTNKSSYEQFST